MSRKNREKQQELLSLPLLDPDGKLPQQHDHTASRWFFLAGPAFTQWISLGFSDLGNITRDAFHMAELFLNNFSNVLGTNMLSVSTRHV